MRALIGLLSTVALGWALAPLPATAAETPQRYCRSVAAKLKADSDLAAAARAAFGARLAAIEKRVLQFPHSAPEVADRAGVHVVAVIDFPYRLFYRVNAATIEVLAIRHTSRRPT